MRRRMLGYGRGGRMKIEQDMAELRSGVRFGETLGSPITLVVENRDWKNWTKKMSSRPEDKDAQIAGQIAVLNNTFAGGEGGTPSGFGFKLAGVTRSDNATWFNANPGGNDERSMKQALKQGGDNALNLYSATAGDYLGWAYLPDATEKPGQRVLDGVVFDWESIPGTSTTYAGRYDKGETATHEVGHWLNLEHTFYRGCNGRGDYVDDTPYEATATSGCPVGKDTCIAPGTDPIHNYMDYSYDQCYTEFTAGQAARMQDAWLTFRAP